MTPTAGRVATYAAAFTVPMVASAALMQLDPEGPASEQVDKPAWTFGLAGSLMAIGVGQGIHETTRYRAGGHALRLAGGGAFVGAMIGATIRS